MSERAPSGFELDFEVSLSLYPRRIDQLLLRRKMVEQRDEEAEVLRGLWPHLGDETILDFKSPTRGFRSGDLSHLVSYGYQYYGDRSDKIDDPSELSLVLVVPTMTSTLSRQIARLKLQLQPLGNGYTRLVGGLYNTITVLLDEVANAEQDEYVRLFTKAPAEVNLEAARWMSNWVTREVEMGDLQELEDFNEVFARAARSKAFVEALRSMDSEILGELLANLDPEQRLAGLNPEQRLADLDPEQRLAGLNSKQLAQLRAALEKKLNGPEQT